MDWSKIHYNAFGSQKAVDECVCEAEQLAEQCDNEQTAIDLLKKIEYLRSVEQVYFVPAIVMSWEEMALSYISSNYAVFECVHYPQIQEIYNKGFEAFSALEEHVKNKMLPEDALFGMIHGFNMDIQAFNKFCKQYGKDIFPPYICKDTTLFKHYQDWKGVKYGD